MLKNKNRRIRVCIWKVTLYIKDIRFYKQKMPYKDLKNYLFSQKLKKIYELLYMSYYLLFRSVTDGNI